MILAIVAALCLFAAVASYVAWEVIDRHGWNDPPDDYLTALKRVCER
jgi:hypothetical protein